MSLERRGSGAKPRERGRRSARQPFVCGGFDRVPSGPGRPAV